MYMEPKDHTEEDIDNDEFYFESDYLPLRGNPDYTTILKTIVVLQAQRIQATKDIDKIAAAEKEALEDPESFVRKLAAGESLNLPGAISVIEVPKIDIGKYNVFFPDLPVDTTKQNNSINDITVRGRVFDESKPETFNQLWTSEEQRRLQELLNEYPPEPIEMRRFAKIARALGNRTTKQVASRVQKYFKKLHSAGMPVPGRLPKSNRPNPNKPHRFNRLTMRPSTFFPAQDIPVTLTMPEDDDATSGNIFDLYGLQRPSSGGNSVASFDRDLPKNRTGIILVDKESDDDDTDNIRDTSTEGRVLNLLSRVRKDKEKDIDNERPMSQHIDYACNYCGDSTIMGTRWNCTTCREDTVNYCSDCLITQLLSDNPHPISHKFEGLRTVLNNSSSYFVNQFDADSEEDTDIKTGSDGIYDRDYLPSKFNDEYNYLDPNFLPE